MPPVPIAGRMLRRGAAVVRSEVAIGTILLAVVGSRPGAGRHP